MLEAAAIYPDEVAALWCTHRPARPVDCLLNYEK